MDHQIPPAVRDALIAAGGCTHTPDPTRGCDTCGRAPQPWSLKKGTIAYDWTAELVDDGQVMRKADLLSVSNLPLDKVARITVSTDSLQYPKIQICVDPRKGERLFFFTRHFEMYTGDGQRKGRSSMPVFEVRYIDQPDRFVRLYLHPLQGPVLSTEDLYV